MWLAFFANIRTPGRPASGVAEMRDPGRRHARAHYLRTKCFNTDEETPIDRGLRPTQRLGGHRDTLLERPPLGSCVQRLWGAVGQRRDESVGVRPGVVPRGGRPAHGVGLGSRGYYRRLLGGALLVGQAAALRRTPGQDLAATRRLSTPGVCSGRHRGGTTGGRTPAEEGRPLPLGISSCALALSQI